MGHAVANCVPVSQIDQPAEEGIIGEGPETGGSAATAKTVNTSPGRLGGPLLRPEGAARFGEQLGGHAPPKGFFLWFRSYTPTEAFFDKSWSLPDIETVKRNHE
jgi:hypothetical protein